MTRHAVTMIPGDGVGPECVRAAVDIIDATGVGIDWIERHAGERTEPFSRGNLPVDLGGRGTGFTSERRDQTYDPKLADLFVGSVGSIAETQ
jgi:hypothetical protein